jgi:dCMP deaminase
MEGFVESEQTKDMLRHAYRLAALYSNDPATQNGAILVNRDGEPIGTGVNRFPHRVKVTPERLERPKKYSFMEHAERNAIYDAARKGNATVFGVLYCPWYACADCARAIIEAGIIRVIGHKQMFDRTPEHWKASILEGNEMFQDAGIEILQYDGMIGNCTGLINGEFWTP